MSFYKRLQPWLIWSLSAAFFFCEYFARVDAGAMLDQLSAALNATSGELGQLGAFFYYPYIVMQIPVGLLVDQHGPRRWLSGAALVSSIGAMVFAFSTHLYAAKCGRFLIGFGASFAFVSTIKLATIWFDKRKWGLLAGLTQGAGMLGAALGAGGFAFLVQWLTWRYAMACVALVLLVFAVLIAFFVRDQRKGVRSYGTNETSAALSIPQSLKCILRSRQSWANALYAGFLYAPTAALGEFWGMTFFHHVYAIPRVDAGLMMSAIFIGWAMGGPIVGWLSDRIQNRKKLMMLSAVMSLFILLFVISGPKLPESVMFFFMLCYGISNTGVALAYAVAGESHSSSLVGMSVAFTNMVSILIGAVLQPLMGIMLDSFWQGATLHHIRLYPRGAYHDVLLLLPASLLLAFISLLFVKESYSKSKK